MPRWRSWARRTATAGCRPRPLGRCRPPSGSHRSGASPETTPSTPNINIMSISQADQRHHQHQYPPSATATAHTTRPGRTTTSVTGLEIRPGLARWGLLSRVLTQYTHHNWDANLGGGFAHQLFEKMVGTNNVYETNSNSPLTLTASQSEQP